jgi:hypothetical protein
MSFLKILLSFSSAFFIITVFPLSVLAKQDTGNSLSIFNRPKYVKIVLPNQENVVERTTYSNAKDIVLNLENLNFNSTNQYIVDEEKPVLFPYIIYIKEIEPKPKVLGSKTGPKGCNYWFAYVDTLSLENHESTLLKKLIKCESTCNPQASNGVNHGLLQFHPSTYRNNGGTDIWNGYEQIDIALKMISTRGTSPWKNCL